MRTKGSRDIDELMTVFKKTGKMGGVEPRSTKHALQIAINLSKNKTKKKTK